MKWALGSSTGLPRRLPSISWTSHHPSSSTTSLPPRASLPPTHTLMICGASRCTRHGLARPPLPLRPLLPLPSRLLSFETQRLESTSSPTPTRFHTQDPPTASTFRAAMATLPPPPPLLTAPPPRSSPRPSRKPSGRGTLHVKPQNPPRTGSQASRPQAPADRFRLASSISHPPPHH